MTMRKRKDYVRIPVLSPVMVIVTMVDPDRSLTFVIWVQIVTTVVHVKHLTTGSLGCLFFLLVACNGQTVTHLKSDGSKFLQLVVDQNIEEAVDYMDQETYSSVTKAQLTEQLHLMRKRLFEKHQSNIRVEGVSSYQLSKEGTYKSSFPYQSVHKISSDQGVEWIEILWHQKTGKIFSVKFPDRKTTDASF